MASKWNRTAIVDTQVIMRTNHGLFHRHDTGYKNSIKEIIARQDD
ncbi:MULTISPECIES: hypothetical protein [unclassified Brenneria]|nr:hypothetical protein [Brenneria sp. L3-3C-1]MEE3642483.1 hypothetical protein [Brenneria sp. L3_3C_1]